MLAHIPPPYPDETVYSILCRLRKILTSTPKAFERKLGKKHGFDANFPVALKRIEIKFDPGWLTAEEALRLHSILPYYRPFNSEEKYQEWRLNALNDDSDVSRSMGMVRNFPRLLKACPLCVREDREEPYFRRPHQLFGAEVCGAHGVELITIPLVQGRLPYKRLGEYSGLINQEPRMGHPVLANLAKDLEDIVKFFPAKGSSDFWTRFSLYLRECGIKFEPSGWRHVVTQYLREARGNMPQYVYEKLCRDWKERSVIMQPAQWLVLVRALGLSPLQFANFQHIDERRWPCQNVLCSKHNEDVMVAEKFLKERSGRFQGFHLILKCPHCGYRVVQRGLRKRSRPTRFTEILDFGQIWNEKFLSLWNDPAASETQYREKLGLSSRSQSLYYAAHLNGLPLEDKNLGKGLLSNYHRGFEKRQRAFASAKNQMEGLHTRVPALTPEIARRQLPAAYFILAVYHERWWQSFCLRLTKVKST